MSIEYMLIHFTFFEEYIFIHFTFIDRKANRVIVRVASFINQGHVSFGT